MLLISLLFFYINIVILKRSFSNNIAVPDDKMIATVLPNAPTLYVITLLLK